MTRKVPAIAILVLTALACPRLSRAEESSLIAEESAGVVAVDGETRLVVRDVQGSVNVRLGKPGEVRFMSAALGDRSKKVPVSVWLSGSEIRLLPSAGAEGQPRDLEIAADPGLYVQVLAARGAVTASGLSSGVEVAGEVVDVDVRGLAGPVQIQTTGGRARIEGVDGDVSLRSQSCAATVTQVKGDLIVALDDSTLDATTIAGGVEGELRETRWSVAGVGKAVSLRSVGGTAQARGLGAGGEIRLTGTPMTLRESKGDFDIETDADFQFQKNEASIHVNSYGGSVTGSANGGLVEVRTDGSHVTISEVVGPARVQGQNLTLRLKGVSGELFVDASSSDLEIDGTGGEITVLAKNSSVVIKNASQAVDVECEGGSVEIRELRAPLSLTADSQEVMVAWASVQVAKDSVIKNTGGGVEIRLPPNGHARIEAESRFGSVETDIEGLEVNDAANQLKGALGSGAGGPMIRIQADRDIVLSGAVAEE